MILSLLRQFDQWVIRRVSYPGETPEVLRQNKYYFKGVLLILTMVSVLSLLTWYLQLRILTLYGLGVLLHVGISIPLILSFPDRIKWIIFFGHTYCLLITFWATLELGGITHSGGLVFCGLIIILFTMMYQNTFLLVWCFSLYVVTLILEVLLQPYLTPDPQMTEMKNVVMFAINSLWMSVTILGLIFYAFRKDAELARLKARRLEEADEIKTRLYANIAHEFRTPLTLITGMAELIHDQPHQQIRERTEIIHRNTDKVLRLVDQMLNLARLEEGSMPVHKIQSNIIPFLSYVAQSFKGLFEYRQVRLHCLPETSSVIMDFDPEKMEEIFSNLISNALKYTPAGGDVYLSCHLSGSDPDTFILNVKDTGIGIPHDKLGYIFDRFYRVESTDKPYEEGSGIGLTIVREYVKLLGGEISVESQPGSGSVFTVLLPVTRQAPFQDVLSLEKESEPTLEFADIHPEDGTLQDSSLPQLLIIEDNAEVIHYLQLILGGKFRVRSAGSGEDGIQMALEDIPDLILSDVMLPGKNGFEVCSTLKKDFRTSHIPVVLLTARSDRASRITGLEHGADAYLIKPFNKRELLACLQNQLVQREKLRIKYSSHHPGQEPAPSAGYDELFLQNVQGILEKEYANENFGIEELCKALDISRVQLHRKLIALTGQPASHYIRSFRLAKAREMLRKTIKPISEIAYETGFSDANYFSRVFSQEFGLPPSELRKGHQAAV